jgi:hypothetical protein
LFHSQSKFFEPPRINAAEHAGLREFRTPIWLWPNVLSLDAPVVAVLWQWMFAKSFGIQLHPAALAVMGLGVWIVYVVDRIMDGLRQPWLQLEETPRHRFYRVNRATVLPWVGVVCVVMLLISTEISLARFKCFVVAACAVAIYFAVIHFGPRSLKCQLPKELAVAVLFASGVGMPVLMASSSKDFVAVIGAFAAILWINAVGIECWEARLRVIELRPWKPKLTKILGRHLPGASMVVGIGSALLAASGLRSEAPLYGAIALSAVSLAVLDLAQESLSCDQLRVLADVALLSPLLFLPFA